MVELPVHIHRHVMLVCQLRDDVRGEYSVMLALVGNEGACDSKRAAWSKKHSKSHLFHGREKPLQSFVLGREGVTASLDSWSFLDGRHQIRARFGPRTEFYECSPGAARPKFKSLNLEGFTRALLPNVPVLPVETATIH